VSNWAMASDRDRGGGGKVGDGENSAMVVWG
jgi:hypothetical protein